MKVSEAAASNKKGELWSEENLSKGDKDFILRPPEPELSQEHFIEAGNFSKAGKASSDIKLTLKKLGVAPEVLRNIAIACYEAEINIVLHSKGGKVLANIYDDRVLIILEDEGPGIEDLGKAMEPGFSTADEQAREMGFGAGLGLPNIKKNCDIMYLSSSAGTETILKILVFFQRRTR